MLKFYNLRKRVVILKMAKNAIVLKAIKTQYLNLQISGVFFWQLAASRLVGKVFSLVLLMTMFGLDMHIKVILVLAHLSALKTGEIFFFISWFLHQFVLFLYK